MNIYLPIISNAVIALILLAGFFIGRKNGFKIQLAKTLIMLPALVGCYFLTPIITSLFMKIDLIQTISTLTYGSQFIGSCVLLLLFLLVYVFANIIITLIIKGVRKHKGINDAKPIKVKGINRKQTRQLKKEQKFLRNMNKPQLSKKSKIFGGLLGLIIGLVFGLVFMLPVKYSTLQLKEQYPEKYEQVTTVYEYTIYGQLDKVIDIGGFIIKGE